MIANLSALNLQNPCPFEPVFSFLNSFNVSLFETMRRLKIMIFDLSGDEEKLKVSCVQLDGHLYF